MKANQKHILTSRQIKRRKYIAFKYYDNGWRYAYITKLGRKWAVGRKTDSGNPMKLALSDQGKSWKEITL